jgi:hypothetical protein
MMDQDSGNRGGASEDTSRAREHVHNAEENRDALAAQSRRTEATASGTDTPIGQMDASGSGTTGGVSGSNNAGSGSSGTASGAGAMNASGGVGAGGTTGHVSDDAGEARENVRAASENRDALAEEHRRVESTLPPDVDSTGR